MTYLFSSRPGAELFLRAGAGVFHDLGYGQVASAFRSYPFVACKTVSSVTFPFDADVLGRHDSMPIHLRLYG
jgi:hypothetical protein